MRYGGPESRKEEEARRWKAAMARYRKAVEVHVDNPHTDLPHGLLEPLPEPMRVRWAEGLRVVRR